MPTETVPFETLLADESAFARFMDVEIVSVRDGVGVADLTVRDALLNRNGVLHGGAVMAFADCIGGTTTTAYLPAGAATATIESKTNFLAAIPPGDRIRAECRIRHQGRTTVVLQTEITRGDGRVAALVVQTQIVTYPAGRG